MNAPARQLLKRHGLRATHPREFILDLFLDRDAALTHADVESTATGDVDRVTVYRTLKTFVERGLLHRVPDDEGAPRYALCSPACGTEAHHHDHVHFKCQTCGQTQCVEEVMVPPVRLPEGFRPVEVSLLVQGVCRNCNKL
ncbi:MAG: Fur family transcriptional regulator [Catalinimonas sp.]